jgi:cell pole-organizing protein PopZ
MSDAKTQQEPSMEEILASIRRIISEDADGAKPAGAPEAAAGASLGAGPAATDDDVLELTDRVNDDGSVASVGGGPDDFPDLDLGAKPSFSLDDHAAAADKDDISFDQDEFSQALMSGASSAAAASAFAQLQQEMSVPPRPAGGGASAPSMGGGGLTIEELVMEAVRPMVKDWLDHNLPGIVEDLVRGEIERVAQAGRRR